MKKCTKCKQFKDVSLFCKDKSRPDGLNYKCKICDKQHNKQFIIDNKEYHNEYHNEYMKQYYQDNKEDINKDINKDEKSKYDKQHYLDNRDERLTYCSEYYQDNKEERLTYCREYYQDNKEERKEYHKHYQQTDHGKNVSAVAQAKYRANKKNATPEDVDDNDIKEIYQERNKLTKETNIQHHVHHVKPLSQGGLHCPSNLEVLTIDEHKERHR